MISFYAKGKLLLSAEYMVLHGAAALAIPLKKGQRMMVHTQSENQLLSWRAEDSSGIWFQAALDTSDWKILESTQAETAKRLVRLLKAAAKLKPDFQKELKGKEVRTILDYPRNYGFGSSSTLISLVAQWSRNDPMELHRRISKGSGYDIACAEARGPLLYQLRDHHSEAKEINFFPDFHEHLYFAWLGQKQDTARSLREIRKGFSPTTNEISWFTSITRDMVRCNDLKEFRSLMDQHEERLSHLLGIPAVSNSFRGLDASIKSLGAWGGDFVMIASSLEKEVLTKQLKGFGLNTIYAYKDLAYADEA